MFFLLYIFFHKNFSNISRFSKKFSIKKSIADLLEFFVIKTTDFHTKILVYIEITLIYVIIIYRILKDKEMDIWIKLN